MLQSLLVETPLYFMKDFCYTTFTMKANNHTDLNRFFLYFCQYKDAYHWLVERDNLSDNLIPSL